MKKRSHIGELGGFAEDPDVLEEETEEAQEAFNFCLASDYIDAIYDEDFESIGLIDRDLLNNIFMWYEIGGGKISEEEERAIRNGSFITNKGRSLIDAVLEDRNDYFALTFIHNGNHDPRLYALCVEEDEWLGLLSSDSSMSKDEYLDFLRNIFSLIDQDYGEASNEGKIRMLTSIKTNLSNLRYAKSYGKIKITDIGSYQFVKDMKKNRG